MDEKQLDGIGFFQRAIGCVALLAVVVIATVATLSLEPFAAPQVPASPDAGSSLASPASSKPAALLSHPLDCDVRITQGMTSVTMSRERCYTTTATRGAK